MTEAELIESAHLAYSNAIGCDAIFWTLAGSYLVTAYQVGEKLTSSQLVIINTLFLFAIGTTSFAIWGFGNAGLEFSKEALLLNDTRPGRYLPNAFPLIAAVFSFLIVLASLKFMWDVRHPRTESRL